MNIPLFVTAYKNIGRENWQGEFKRTDDDYIQYFGNLCKSNFDLICFCEPYIAEILKTRFGFNNCFQYDICNTFFHYLPIEESIIQSSTFQHLTRHRGDPECRIPEYNIINHNKCIFIQRAMQMFPDYSHYAWIDFGYIHNKEYILTEFDWSKLSPDKIHISSHNEPSPCNIRPPWVVCVEDTLGNYAFAGGLIVIPNAVVQWYFQTYHETLVSFYNQQLVHDDQGVFLQLYKEHHDKVLVYVFKNSPREFISYFSKG